MEKGIIGDSWEIFYKDEFSSKKHWHKEIEFTYLVTGKLIICVDEVMHELHEGELFVVSGGVVHYYIETEEKYKVGIEKMSLQAFDGFSKKVKDFFRGFYSSVLYVAKDDQIKTIFRDIINLISKQNIVIQESVLISRIIDLTVYLSSHEELIKNREEYRKNSDAELLERMRTYFAEHYNEKIGLADMASHLGFSESYCSKYIKKKTNMNFLEYLNSCRIMRAETLLRTTENSVTEIAYAIGFTSIQSFNRVFKSFCDESPTEYRKRLHDKKNDP